jgi:3-deoxy-D-manno-octulosonic-acid transferase
MYFFYSLALSFLFLLLLPYFIFQAIKYGKYVGSFKERLGNLPDSISEDLRPTLWVHTVSVGEFNAARPLLAQIKMALPEYRLVVSTTTLTGQALARAEYPHKLDAVFYFPFDWKFSVRRALRRLRPAMVIILETELWPNFLRECHENEIATVIVNGRISPRSFARYAKIRRFISGVLNDVSLLIMQSAADAERVTALGADPSRVRVCGNLKYDVVIGSRQSAVESPQSESKNSKAEVKSHESKGKAQEIDEQFNLSASKHLLVAGSTAAGEEEILLQAFDEVRHYEGLEDARLLIAPRHPERFNEVANLLAASKFSFARRSQNFGQVSPNLKAGDDVPNASPDDASLQNRQLNSAALQNQLPRYQTAKNAEVILLDSIGELAAAYEFAAVVFVGGSLVAKGGHNIIEAAAFAKPVLVGSHTENFRQIIADFAKASAVVQINAPEADLAKALAKQVIVLLTETEAAQALGKRALDILLANRGATDCALAAIQKVLDDSKGKR